jgi:hypothetical protein
VSKGKRRWGLLADARGQLSDWSNSMAVIRQAEDTIRAAIISGKVELKGKRGTDMLPVVVDSAAISEDADIDIGANEIRTRSNKVRDVLDRPSFWDVRIDLVGLKLFEREYLMFEAESPDRDVVELGLYAALKDSIANYKERDARPPAQRVHWREIKQRVRGVTFVQYQKARKVLAEKGKWPQEWGRCGRPRNRLISREK